MEKRRMTITLGICDCRAHLSSFANASVTWGYDAAGNRVSDSAQPGSWTYDNLNRILTSPGMTYDHDILGNRLLKSGGGGGSTTTMMWDDLNRMIGFKSGYNTQHVYAYRADGMRSSKTWYTGSSLMNWTRYRYDGQMGVEDIEGTTTNGVSTITTVTRTGLGARSVEVISKTTSSGNTLTYPLYDIHGNMVAALSKAGSSFSVGEARTYDAWGQVRSQVGSDGKLRYCANLGHKQDDESGLIYMRARYYEPSSGRFINEDLKRSGNNWYNYATNNPQRFADASGCESMSQIFILSLLTTFLTMACGAVTSVMICGLVYGANNIPYQECIYGPAWSSIAALAAAVIGGIFDDLEKGKLGAKEFEDKMFRRTIGSVVGGWITGPIGTFIALKLGDHQGKVLAAVWNIDFPEFEVF